MFGEAGVGATGVLGGIALVITAVGGIVGTVLAARRPKPGAEGVAPTSVSVWVETLRQLDDASEERDAALADLAATRAKLVSAEQMLAFYRQRGIGE